MTSTKYLQFDDKWLLPLNVIACDTCWMNKDHLEIRDNSELVKFENIKLDSIPNILKTTRMYSIAAILATNWAAACYYLILIPQFKNPAVMFFVKNDRNFTDTINRTIRRHGGIQTNFIDQGEVVFEQNLFRVYLSKSCVQIHETLLTKDAHQSKDVREVWDTIVTGIPPVSITFRCKKKKKDRVETDNEIDVEDKPLVKRKQDCAKKNQSHILPKEVVDVLFAEKLKQDGNLPLRNALMSKDSGGINSIISLVPNSVSQCPMYLSDYHIATNVKGAYAIPHNQETILRAKQAVEKQLLDEGLSKNSETFVKAIGAVSDKFFEGIEHRMQPEESCDSKITDMKVDIDQVALRVFKFKLKPLAGEEVDAFLTTMYNALLKTVLLDEQLLHGRISVGYNLFGNNQNSGGHTYMSAREKKDYIALLTHGAMMEVLKVSVKLHDNREHDTHQKEVWAATKFVANWYESRGPNAIAGQSVRALSLDVPGNVHDIFAGPMFPMLVAMYLSTTVTGGVSIVMETYGGKVLKSVRYHPINNKVLMEEAVNIVDQLKDALHKSAPFIISRFSKFCLGLSQSSLCLFANPSIRLIWGLGCTVQTLIPSPIISMTRTETESDDTSFISSIPDDASSNIENSMIFDVGFDNDLSQSSSPSSSDKSVLDLTDISSSTPSSPIKLFDTNGLSLLPSFGSNKTDEEYLSNLSLCIQDAAHLSQSDQNHYSPAFTVINVLEPSLLSYCDNPLAWFMDPRGNELRKVIDERTKKKSQIKKASNVADDEDDNEFENEQVADSESNGLETQEIEHASNAASHRLSSEGSSLHKFLPLSSIHSHVATFPILGGILPLHMQPTNYTRKGKVSGINVPDTISENIYRIQQYAVLPKNACGECNVPLKSTSEMAHYELDIYSDNVESIYNLHSFDNRLKKFVDNSVVNMERLVTHGNPGRIEVAFDSLVCDNHYIDLLNGIRDVIQMCLNSTKSYSAIKCAGIIQFALDGTVSRLRTMQDMMKEYAGRPEKYFELFHIRTETAARLHSFYSGRGTLKNLHLFSPKNSYMAGRPTHKMLMPLSHSCRERVLQRTILGVDLFHVFQSNLFDTNNKAHKRIEVPQFELQFVDKINNKTYKCGKVCDKCWMVFATMQHIKSFDCHSCVDKIKGKAINITDKRFMQYQGKMLEELNDLQSAFVSMVHHDAKGPPPNVFLTGGAGSGKTHTLKLSIADTLFHHGMDSFIVIAATKMAASLVNGVTYHSFLGLTGREGEDTGQAGQLLNDSNKQELLGRHINNLRETSIFRRIQSTLKTIYIDEVGMMSKDQFDFLNEMLQYSRKSMEPFGGVQIILCGDVLQLPPIVKDNRPGEVFFFESKSYDRGKFKTVYLETCYRQKDPKFIRILNRMREGCCSEADMEIINNEWGSDASRNSARDALKGLKQLYRKERMGSLGSTAQSKIITKANNQYCNEGLVKKHKSTIDKKEYELSLLPENQRLGNQRLFISEADEMTTVTDMITEADKQMTRLKISEAGQNVDFNFVMNCENIENDAINIAYGESRLNFDPLSDNIATRKLKSVNDAEDSCSNGAKMTAAMKDFLTKQTKTEQSLVIYVDQRVIFTWNGSSVFTSNNSMAIVKVIKYDITGKVESITVEPCTAPGIVPHPVVVTAKLYTENYPDPSGQNIPITRIQFPLKAADCGNAFTTQGISLSIPMLFNGSRLMKESKWARVYVAASRVTDKKYFFTMFKLRAVDIKPNRFALNFDNMLRATSIKI